MPDSRLTTAELDDQLRAIANALVAEAPEAPAELPTEPQDDVVLRLVDRPEPRRWWIDRRGLLAAAAAVVVVLAAAGIGMFGLREDPGTETEDVTPVVAVDGPGPQRLITWEPPAEVRADNSVTALPRGQLSPTALQGFPEGLADGRTVMVGVPELDGPPGNEDNLPIHLLVVQSDGSVETGRRVDEPGEDVALLAATPQEAILARTADDGSGAVRYVAHDLETGDERMLLERPWEPVLVDLYDQTLVFVDAPDGSGEPPPCGIETVNLVTGDVRELETALDCGIMDSIRVSPDGTKLAMVGEWTLDERVGTLNLAVVDLVNDRLLSNQVLGENVVCEGGPCADAIYRQAGFVAMGWEDETTLRIALADILVQPTYGWDGLIRAEALIVERVSPAT